VCTSYTKKVVFEDGKKVVFQNDENNFANLCLIQRVRREGKNFLKDNICSPDRVDFYNLYEDPTKLPEIVKIDLRSAYWKYSLQRGIISKETDEMLDKLYDIKKYQLDYLLTKEQIEKYEKEKKYARLKALGSLATRRVNEHYVDGVLDDVDADEEETRGLYFMICEGIDQIMKEAAYEFGGRVFYYYWDCIFAAPEIEKDVVDFFKEHGYGSKSSYTPIEHIKIGDNSFLVTKDENKMYGVKEDQQFILENGGLDLSNEICMLPDSIRKKNNIREIVANILKS
jgi:hypothetical protein